MLVRRRPTLFGSIRSVLRAHPPPPPPPTKKKKNERKKEKEKEDQS